MVIRSEATTSRLAVAACRPASATWKK